MAFFEIVRNHRRRLSCLTTFGHLFLLLSRLKPKLVVISPLALKWHVFKVEALIFPSKSLHNHYQLWLRNPWQWYKQMIKRWYAWLTSLYDFWQFQKNHFVICLLYGVYRNISKGVKFETRGVFSYLYPILLGF